MRTDFAQRPSAAVLLEHRWLLSQHGSGGKTDITEWLLPDEGD